MLTRILFILIAVWAFQAFAENKDDKPCLEKIQKTIRGVNTFDKVFWSKYEASCYERIKDEKSGLKNRLEKLGYYVYLADYNHFGCVDYCYAAVVKWDEIKNLKLTKSERNKIASDYLAYEKRDSDACAGYNPVQKCQYKEKWKFMGKCLKETGNTLSCHNKFYKVKK